MQKVIISIDTEFTSSNVITGNCLQLAFVVMLDDPIINNNVEILEDSKNWIIDTLSLCFVKQDNKNEEQHVVEWWNGFPEIYKRIMEESKDINISIKTLQLWLNNIYSKYEVIGFLADHSSVDMPWFRNLFLTHCDQTQTKFKLPWGCVCTTNMVNTLLLLGIKKKEINKFCYSQNFPHTHYALDDAVQTGYYYLKLKLLMKQYTIIKKRNINLFVIPLSLLCIGLFMR